MNSSISKKCIFFLIVPLLSVGETAGQEWIWEKTEEWKNFGYVMGQ
jgi:hypothetical protein